MAASIPIAPLFARCIDVISQLHQCLSWLLIIRKFGNQDF
jgi:hypothetical protein